MFSKVVTDADLAVAVNAMREADTDLADYEIKDAKGGFPSSVVDSMVAFANTSGGVVILGVSEKTFDSVDVDVKMLQSQLAQAARDRISPVHYGRHSGTALRRQAGSRCQYSRTGCPAEALLHPQGREDQGLVSAHRRR